MMLHLTSIMAAAGKTVHVFSVIPSLSHILREKLPDVEVVEVKLIGDILGKYSKRVLQEEVAALQEAEILLVDNNLLSQVSEQLPKILWAQGTWAGVEGLVSKFKDKPKPTFPITRMASESFSQLMAEYAVGWIISHERGWLDCRMYQLKSEWGHKDNIAYYRSLRDLTVGVLGMGIIGKEVARSLKFFNTTVHAYTRTAPAVENKSSDVDKYWKNAVFINIGRGDIINEADIIKALDYGWISVAILDVFVKEPLSPESLLWKHPKVMITPHSAGVSRAVDVADAFVANFRRYTQGLPIQNIIDFDRGY